MADGNPKQLFLAHYFTVYRNTKSENIKKKIAATFPVVSPSPKVENKKQSLTIERSTCKIGGNKI